MKAKGFTEENQHNRGCSFIDSYRIPTRKILLILFSVTAIIYLSATPLLARNPIRTVDGIVTQVTDGDTVKMETTEGTKLKIRLYGIDAPEMEKISRRTGMVSKAGQPYGEEAYEVLKSKMLDSRVTVDIMAVDRYKRMVGIVYLDNKNINLEMVREGWAWAYREYLDRPYASEYLNAERDARTKRSSLWQQPNPQPPWEFRKLMRLR
jgi:endonuclease YncB( thermonuclease family)